MPERDDPGVCSAETLLLRTHPDGAQFLCMLGIDHFRYVCLFNANKGYAPQMIVSMIGTFKEGRAVILQVVGSEITH